MEFIGVSVGRREARCGAAAVVALAAVGLLIAETVASEAPPLPSSHFGSVTISGAPAPAGTAVSARFAGATIAASVVFLDGGSRYRIDVPGDRADTPEIEGPQPGQNFEIRVGGAPAASSVWTAGSYAALDLSAAAGADLAVALDDGVASVGPAAVVTATLEVENITGPAASGVELAASLPDGAMLLAASDGGGWVEGEVRWPLFALGVGGSAQRTATFGLPSSFPAGVTSIVSRARVAHDGASGGDPQPANDSDEDLDQLVAEPDVAVTIGDDRTAASPADTLVHRTTVSNVGTQNATGVAVSVRIPPGAVYFSSSHGGSVDGSGLVSFPPMDLAAGASAVRSVTTRVPADADPSVTQLAFVGAAHDDGVNGPDPQPSDNEATDLDELIHAADLQLAAVDATGSNVDPQSFALTGTVVVSYRNGGTLPAPASTLAVFEDLDLDGAFDRAADRVLGEVSLPFLPSGAQGSTPIAVAGVLELRDDRIFAAIDADDEIAELDEENNLGESGADCASAGDLANADPVVELSWPLPGGPTFEPLSVDSISTPVIVQLTDDDGDGSYDEDDIPEIVFVTANLAPTFPPEPDIVLRAIRGDTGAALWNVPGLFTIPPSFFSLCGLAAGDIDLDGRPEIVVSVVSPDGYGFLQAYEHTGAFKWRSQTYDTHPFASGTSNRDSPSLADLEGDGDVEIVIGAHVFDALGNRVWAGAAGQAYQTQRNNQLVGGALSVVADVDLDGLQEIVTGNTLYRFDGEIVWQRPEADGYPAIVNADGDPQAEIVVVSRGFVRLHDTDGTALWGPLEMPGSDPESGGPPAVGDLDGDGVPEIVVAGSDVLWALRLDGSALWQASTRDYSSTQTGASLFDLDGDGTMEVAYRDERRFRVYRGLDGGVLFEHTLSSTTMTEMPVVADVDRDGNAEIVVTTDHAWDSPVPPGGRTAGLRVFGDAADQWLSARTIWNQHAYAVDAIEDDSGLPASPPWGWLAHESFRAGGRSHGAGLSTGDVTAGRLLVDVSSLPLVRATVRIGNAGRFALAPGVEVALFDGDTADPALHRATASIPVALPPGGYFDLELTFDAGAGFGGTLTALADSASRERECDEANNLHTAGVDVTALGLWLTKGDGTESVAPGDTLTYVLAVQNAFAGPATGVVLLDTLPAGAIFVSASDGGTIDGSVVNWPSFTLASGASASRTVVVQVDPELPLGTTTLVNIASVTDDGAQGPDPTPANNQATDVDTVVSVVADAGGPYFTDEGASVQLDASGSHDRDGGAIALAWDLDGDGAFDDGEGPSMTWSFGDEGSYTVRVRVTDDEGEIDVDQTSVTVANVAPTVQAPEPLAGAEGSTFPLSGWGISDPGTSDLLAATISWGDGVVEPVALVAGVPTAAHTYAEDGSYALELCVSDGDGATGCAGSSAEIANEPPDVPAQRPLRFDGWQREEWMGGSSTRWSVAPGGASVVEELNGRPSVFFGEVPAYGSYELTLRVDDNWDDDFVGLAVGFDSGDFADPVAEFLLVDWKKELQDGARRGLALSRVLGAPLFGELWGHVDLASNGSSNRVVELRRATTLGDVGWARHRTYHLRLEVRPDRLRLYVDGSLEIDYSGSIPPGRLALYDFSQEEAVFGGERAAEYVTVLEGGIATARIPFRDPGVLDTHDGTVDWGDGQPAPGEVVESGGQGELVAARFFADDAELEIEACVTDDEGDTDCALRPLASVNVAPSVSLIVNSTGFLQDAVTLTGSTFLDPGHLDTHTVDVDWGDGTTQTSIPSGGGGTWSFGGSHVFSAPGNYVVTACAIDDDGGEGCSSRTISLIHRNLDLSLALSGARVARPDNELLYTLLTRNVGNANSPSSDVLFTLPPHVTFLQASHGGTFANGVVTFHQGLMFPGSQLQRTARVRVDSSPPLDQPFPLVAEVISTGGTDHNPSNNVVESTLRFTDAVTPIVTFGGPWSGAEGALLSVTDARFSDTSPPESHTATFFWGDGTSSQGTISFPAADNSLIRGSHTYADDGSYTVELCVTDGAGNTGCSTNTATIANRPAHVVDPGALLLSDWQVEEYAGTPSANWNVAANGLSVTQSVNSRPSIFFSPLPAIGANVEGVIRVIGTTWDDDFIGFVIGFEPEDVTNPEADFLLIDWKQEDQDVAREGLAVSRVLGPVRDSELWAHWDDPANGSAIRVEELARGMRFGSAGWEDNTDYRMRLETGPDRLRIWVNEVLEFDLEIAVPLGKFGFYNYSQESVQYRGFTNGMQQQWEGESFPLLAPFTDAGVLDSHSGDVDWDDGESSVAETESTDGFGLVTNHHAYPDNGNFLVEVCIEDDDGAGDCGQFPLLVLNLPPEVVPAPPLTAYRNLAQEFELASFEDPGIFDSHTATVDWGDGNIDTALVIEDAGFGGIRASHTYATEGSFAVRVCVEDDEGAQDCGLTTIEVALTPPAIRAEKTAAVVDRDGDGLATPGDDIVYRIEIHNAGEIDATGVRLVDPIPANTTLVPGSIFPESAVVDTDPVTVDVDPIDPQASSVLQFAVTVVSPLPPGVGEIVNSGVVHSNESAPVPTDDPALPGFADPTRTPVFALPGLTATKVAELLDLDGNGVATPGDQVEWTILVGAGGDTSATGVLVEDAIGDHLWLVPGSLDASSGRVLSTDPLAVVFDTIEAGGVAALRFRTEIDPELPVDVPSVQNQATVLANEVDAIDSDDPATAEPADPTVVPVYVLPALTIAGGSVTEGHTGTSPLAFAVTLDRPAPLEVAVSWMAVAGTALAGEDFVASSGTLVFPVGSLAGEVVVPIVGDLVVEGVETLRVVLSEPVHAVLAAAEADGTVVDDDETALSVSDALVEEGGVATIAITLSAASALPVAVEWTTAGGTAVEDVDFVAASGVVTLAPLAIGTTIDLATIEDAEEEITEHFVVLLSNPTVATLADGEAEVAIADDDAPACTLACPSSIERTADAGACLATVELPPPIPTGECGSIVCSPPSGPFVVGTTEIVCTSATTLVSCAFEVTVVDAEPPSVIVGASDSPNDPGACGAEVDYGSSAGDNCPGAQLTSCDPPGGSFFSVGVTTVTCVAIDASGNAGSGSGEVVVTDVEAPTLAVCPADIQLAVPPGAAPVEVDFDVPPGYDNCPDLVVGCLPEPLSSFPDGETAVVCTATDGAGLAAACAFAVVVEEASILEIPALSRSSLAVLAALLAGAGLFVLRRGRIG